MVSKRYNQSNASLRTEECDDEVCPGWFLAPVAKRGAHQRRTLGATTRSKRVQGDIGVTCACVYVCARAGRHRNRKEGSNSQRR